MKTIYRVSKAIDYNGQKERKLFYTENREQAEQWYSDMCKEIDAFAKQNGSIIYNNKPSERYCTYYAKADENYHGAIAKFEENDICRDNFLELYNLPLF